MTLEVFEGGKKAPGDRCIYPVSPRARSRETHHGGVVGAEIVNEIDGGLTLREYIAIEFASAMLSNPAFLMNANNSARLMIEQALTKADDLIAAFSEKPCA